MFVEISEMQDGHKQNYKSPFFNISAGVPQGSILGPILFILLTNDLINYINKILPDIQLVVFADDTNAIIGANNSKELTEKVNAALSYLYSWFTINKLKINSTKTKIMLFKTTARYKDTMEIRLNDDKI